MKSLWRGNANNSRFGMAAILILSGSTGCLGGAPDEDDSVVITSSPLTFRPAQSGAGDQGGFSWGSGSPAKAMVPSQGNTCFLTALYGTFRSAGDAVQIGNQTVNGVPTWVLYGGGGSGTPAASAFCFMGVPAVFAGHWSQGQAAVDLGSATNRTCFLTGIQGNFNTLFSTGGVRVRVSGGRWLLDGVPFGASAYQASATCVDRASNADIVRTSTGTTELTLNSFEDGPYGCALTSVSGVLAGGALVQTIVNRPIGAWRWLLGESQASVFLYGRMPLTASARCIR